MKLLILFVLYGGIAFGFFQGKNEIVKIGVPNKLAVAYNTVELVVVFENYNRKFYEDLIGHFNQIECLKMKGFCESSNCFYLEIDMMIFKSAKEAFQVLESKTKKFLPVFKEGTTSVMVVSNCQRN